MALRSAMLAVKGVAPDFGVKRTINKQSRGTMMTSRIRSRISYGIVGLGLLFATPLFAQAPSLLQTLTGTPPSRVVDSNGKLVGHLLGQGTVQREINGVWVVLNVAAEGFGQTQPNNIFYFSTSSTCSPPFYMAADQLPVTGVVTPFTPGFSTTSQVTIYFPGKPVTTQAVLPMASTIMFQNGAATCNTSGQFGSGNLFAPVQSVSVSSLGLVPPFTLK
jgi:hypothetical protein